MMSRKTLLIFFLPGAIFMMVFLVVPLVQMLVNSFFNYELGGEREFIGLANYIKLFTSSSFLKPLRNTIVYVVIAVSFELIFGLVMALLFNTPFPGNKVLRSFFLTPLMIAPIVAGLIWKLMLNTQFGIVNMLLEKIGIIGNINDIMWLADPNIALISCCIADIWLTTPFMMLMLLAGLNGLDHSVIEAASIDGASAFQKLFRIKLPGIMPVLLTAVSIRIVDAARTFDIVWTLTEGGPQGSSELLSVTLYRILVRYNDVGYASAIAIIFVLLLLVFALVFMRDMWKPRKGRT